MGFNWIDIQTMSVDTAIQYMADEGMEFDREDYLDESRALMEWCERHRVHYYARPHDRFSIQEGCNEARDLGMLRVVLEDLS